MAIDTSHPLDIPLGGGLAEGIDPKLLPFGASAELVNYEVTRNGGLVKRRGFGGELTATEVGASAHPVQSVSRLLSDGDGLLAIAPDYTDSLPHIYSHSSGMDRWADLDTVPPCSVRRDPLVRLNRGSRGALVTAFGTGASYLLVVYGVDDGSGGADFYYRVIDRDTGSIIVRETLLTSTTSSAATVSVGGNAWVLYNDAVGLQAKQFSGTDPTSTTTVTLDATATIFKVAAAYLNLGKFVACWVKGSANTVLEMRTLNASNGAVIDTAFYNTAGPSIQAIDCAGDAVLGTAFAWIEGGAGEVLADIRDTSLASGPGPTPIETAPPSLNRDDVGVELDKDGNACIFYMAERTAGEPAAIARLFAPNGSVYDRHIAYRCAWAGGPRRMGDSDRIFAVLGVPQQGTLTSGYSLDQGPAHFALVCVDDVSSAAPPLLVGHLATTVARAGGLASKFWPTDSSEQVWVLAASTVTSDAPGFTNDTSGVDLITLDFSPQQASAYHSTTSAPLLLLGGGLVASLDQHQVVENGFLQAPQITGATTAAAGFGVSSAVAPGNAYLYRARYEWVDDRGQIHVSPWSDDYTLELEDVVPTTYTVTLAILCTSVTRRGRSGKGQGRDAQIAVYRSTANGASTTGDVVYYRLLPYGDSDAALNDRTAYSVTFDDTSSDAVLLGAGNGQVVSPGDVLAPICPPASADLLTHRGRAWLLDAEDRRRVWPSRLLVEGEAPAFCSELVQRLSDSPTEIRALVGVDDKTVYLCEDRIYYTAGDGPDDTGATGGFSGPWLVTAQHGCLDARSVVQTPMGGIFLAAPGFMMIDRALALQFVGEPVQTTLETYSTCLGSCHDPARNRAVWLMANADSDTLLLVYDYEHQVWSKIITDVTNRLRSMALWGGRMVVAWDRTFEGVTTHLIRQEGGGAAPGWDLDSDAAPAWASGVYETPWICPGGPGGYQRVRGLFLLAEKLSHCRVQVDIFTNFDATTVVQTKTFSLGPGSTISGLPLVRYVLPAEIQACEAIKIRVTDLDPEIAGEYIDSAARAGLGLTRMALELGPERGFPRLPATNRGGS